ncbi:MAG: SpvB/TcaC N-terminal domain-containing protein, partial [Sedimenticola sp.]
MENCRLVTLVLSSVTKLNNRIKRRLPLSLLALAVTLGAVPAITVANTVAGYTPGEFSVDQSGSAGYTLPIGIPAGAAGMQPELSINYSSGGGNGLLGVGFSLGGFSSIHRCSATLVQDGFNRGVQLNDNDRFCLDGQRLIAVSGTNGAAGTEYRTELEGFSRIISHGQQGSGPAHWSVETKSGQTLEFGNSDDSRVEVLGKQSVRLWAVNRIADAIGNLITYSYYEDGNLGEHYADRIDYGSVTVKFHYEDRPDSMTGFSLGGRVNSTQRLTAVESTVNGQPVKRYNLDYRLSETTGRSLLTGVSECDGGGNCLPPTQFDFEPPEQGHDTALVTTDLAGSGWSEAAYERHLRDINNDGRTDLILIRKSNAGTSVFLGKSDGGLETAPIQTNTGVGSLYALISHLLDVNGDGIIDLVLSPTGGPDYGPSVYLHVFPGNGDGTFDTGKISSYIYEYTPTEANSAVGKYGNNFGDVNGDGYIDFILTEN